MSSENPYQSPLASPTDSTANPTPSSKNNVVIAIVVVFFGGAISCALLAAIMVAVSIVIPGDREYAIQFACLTWPIAVGLFFVLRKIDPRG